MRYINLVEPDWFVARGQGGHHDWPNLGTYDSWLLTPGSKPRRIIDDTSVSQSLWARKVNGKYYGVGGESVDEDDIEYRGAEDEVRDGLRVLEADRLEEIKDGAWMNPEHEGNLAVDGGHKGCVTARQETGQKSHHRSL